MKHDMKSQAKRLRNHLKETGKADLKHSEALQATAALFGYRNWQTALKQPPTPDSCPKLWIIQHEHRYGTDLFTHASVEEPTTEEIIKLKDIDFDEDREEFILIESVEIPAEILNWVSNETPTQVGPITFSYNPLPPRGAPKEFPISKRRIVGGSVSAPRQSLIKVRIAERLETPKIKPGEAINDGASPPPLRKLFRTFHLHVRKLPEVAVVGDDGESGGGSGCR